MPSTNYEPPGYELVERDEQLCRGNVFYTPGAALSNIDAKNVKPNFLLYRRKAEVAPPRACLCHHKREELRRARERQSKRQINETKLRRKVRARVGLRSGSGLGLADPNPNPSPNPNPQPHLHPNPNP